MKNSDKFNTIPGNMVRIQKIVSHPEFKKSMESIRELEKDRIFCRHGMEHLLDVSRIAYIDNMETGAGYAKDVIYAAGLLHDVGKYLQYMQVLKHHTYRMLQVWCYNLQFVCLEKVLNSHCHFERRNTFVNCQLN